MWNLQGEVSTGPKSLLCHIKTVSIEQVLDHSVKVSHLAYL